MNIKELKQKRFGLVKQAREILDLVETEKRDWTAEEEHKYENIDKEVDELTAQIEKAEKDAERLARLLRPLKAKVNLIPFNEFEGSAYSSPEDYIIEKFQEILLKHHYTVVIRQSKGRDISAACGQLSGSWNGRLENETSEH